jgi:hypothetical protein
MKPADIIPLVEDGKFDKVLDALTDACIQRRSYLHKRKAARNSREFGKGTRVVIIPPIRPKYLVGITGIVCDPPLLSTTPRKQGYLWVDMGERVGRYGPVVHMPAACLKRKDA